MIEGGKRLILASSNPGKLVELSALLARHDWQVESACAYTNYQVEENAPTYLENALHKARAASRVSGLPAIADDSGLEVDALHGLPGIRSARFAGEHASDQQNLCHLLNALNGIPESHRGACFRCLMVYIERPDDPLPLIAQGVWRGQILTAPKGTDGFGYDPVFYLATLGRSAAELAAEHKNRLSHRGQAIRALVKQLVARRSV